MFGGIGFGNPLILWGLLACSIPILLNFFNRHRYQRVKWAAMEFLLRAVRKNKRRIQLENLLLLLVRMLLIAALVLTFARPYAKQSALLGITPSSKSNVVIVLDNSYSMGAYWGNKTYFDMAKDVAKKLVRQRQIGDKVALLLLNEKTKILSPVQLITSTKKGRPDAREELITIIEKTQVSDYSSDFSQLFPALKKLVPKFEETASLQKSIYIKKVYFLTDNQALGWKKSISQEDLDFLFKQQVKFYIVNVSQKSFESSTTHPRNLAIVDFQTQQKDIYKAIPSELLIKVKNYSAKEVKNATLKVSYIPVSEEKKSLTQKYGQKFWFRIKVPFSIHSGEVKTIPLQMPGRTLRKTGLYKAVASIELPESSSFDILPSDNKRQLTFVVQDRIRVLLVDDLPQWPPRTRFLQAAFLQSPKETNSENFYSVFRCETSHQLPLEKERLERYDIVVLVRVSDFPLSSRRLLREYVEGGGRVVIFLGDYLTPPVGQMYNENFFSHQSLGFLPARLGKVEKIKPQYLKPTTWKHPIFSVLDADYRTLLLPPQGSKKASVPIFYKISRLQPHPKARILAKFSPSGLPAMVEGEYGKGKVLLLNFSADRSWTNLPAYQVNLILIERLGAYLRRPWRGKKGRNFELGEEVSLPRRKDLIGILQTPAGKKVEQPFYNDSPRLLPQVISRAGFYTLEWYAASELVDREYFALNLASEEGDLRSASSDRVQAKLQKLALEQFSMKQVDAVLASTKKKESSGGEFWRHFLSLAIFLLVLELVLARYIGQRRS
ncbi:MAG: VWA domain-containing protein [Planctomycetota bacterium]|nr:MAG: VWA domain-containing protein [Planctomycetota bacterium]